MTPAARAAAAAAQAATEEGWADADTAYEDLQRACDAHARLWAQARPLYLFVGDSPHRTTCTGGAEMNSPPACEAGLIGSRPAPPHRAVQSSDQHEQQHHQLVHR